MNKQQNIYLISDRECGDCTSCCIHPLIDTEELKKPPNVACHNLSECGGCSIYGSWPTICEEWFCAWRSMPELDSSWRPDLKGILLEFARENFPAPFTDRTGFRFTIIDDQKPFNNDEFVKFVKKQIQNGVPCILSYGNEEGQMPPAAFLNIALSKAVMSNDLENIEIELKKAMKACLEQPVHKIILEDNKLKSVP